MTKLQLIMKILNRFLFEKNNLLNRARSAHLKYSLMSGGNKVGQNFQIRKGARFSFDDNCKIKIGDNVLIADGASIFVGENGNLDIEDRVFVGMHTVIIANSIVKIGAGTQIAHGVSIIDTDHRFQSPPLPLCQQGQTSAPIFIEKECWIAANAVILSGIRIGEHSVIGASSVVTRDVNPKSVAVGNPARTIKSLP